MRCSVRMTLTMLAFGFVASAARAQFPQYTVPGSLGLPTITVREQIEKAMGNAPWKLGPVKVQPWIGLRDIGYVDNVTGTSTVKVSDVTATFGLGLKAYLPVGPKVFVAAHVLPQYVWWRDTVPLRGWHSEDGLGVFAYFNHLTVEAEARSNKIQRFLSSEAVTPVDVSTWGGSLKGEVDIAGPFAFFAGGTYDDITHDNPADATADVLVQELDRVERTASGGLRWKRQELAIGLGATWSEVEFQEAGKDRSNSGVGPLLQVTYKGSKMVVDVDAAYRDLTARDGSEFTEFKDLSGHAKLGGVTKSRFNWAVYGGQSLVYALQPGASYYRSQRLGVDLGYQLGWRTDLKVYYENGSDDYVGVPGVDLRRVDDVTSYGGNFQWKVFETSTFVFGVDRSNYDSNLPGRDRDFVTMRLTLNLGGPPSW